MSYRYGSPEEAKDGPYKKKDNVESKLKSKTSFIEDDQTRGKSFAKNVKLPDDPDSYLTFEPQPIQEEDDDDEGRSALELEDVSIGLPTPNQQELQPSDKKPKFSQQLEEP